MMALNAETENVTLNVETDSKHQTEKTTALEAKPKKTKPKH